MELQKMGEEMGTEKLNGTIPDNNKAAGLEDGYEEEERALTEQEEFLPHIASKKLNQFTDFEGKTTFGMSVFNLSNAIMGSGILGLAYAMKNTGIVLFLVLLICIALLSSYSIHLLLKCAGVVGIRAYEQLGFRAFGHGGKVVAAVIISIHNIGAMSSYLFIVKSELPLVIQTFLGLTENNSEWYMNGNVLIIVVSVCVILPLALMKHLGYLGYTSGLSLTCMVFFLISVIYKKFQIACPLNSTMDNNSTMDLKDESCTVEIFTINSQTAYAIPILAFAFVCHPEVLPIYTELRRASKRRMQNVANVSILAMFCMYLLTAVFGYLTFYENVEAEMLHTYINVDPLDKLILCVRLAVLLAVTLTVPVVLFPIRRAIHQLLFHKKDFSWPRHVTIACCLLVTVNLLVIFVPNIKDIFGVIGATSAPSLIFILPSVFYIRIVPNEKEPLLSRSKIQAACFAALGFIFMVMSLSFIIVDWVTTGKSSGVGH
ncbi:sodium-coupled neutral amino acid transporter 5 [Varanus komodoensis]|uniref:Amino acid transporter transmembrane domain-containing protein n=1 Tax=Varanus komodoensis TaxID=61221 RepID=A0A8D2JK42_VARKO|nr:sodium-coupled neutral amino acid transporter 5 [Varanus komodoensis]XP_044287226.1 sodium-coupled neutral amino acid transporter 5 [Varanus komodoensis]XP_044287227.1 sodium-coupled neutral amino acid transporter 5 [Varanus komodoensis]